MTYEEIKERLTKCETILKKVQSNSKNKPQVDVVKLEEKITFLKESLTKKAIETKLNSLKEQEDKGTEGTVSTDDEGEAADLAKKGVNVKLTKEQADILFTVEETKAIAKEVAKSLLAALRDVGDEVASGKIRNIEENSFDIFVEYKNDFEDEFSFYIKDDTLHLVDFSFDKEIGEVGVKPSGEAIIHKDVITNNLVKHFQALNEQEYAKDIEVQADEEEEYQKLKNTDTVKEFGPMYGSQNTEYNESEELKRIGEIDDLLQHTDNQEAFYAWDRAANTYLGRGNAQYWSDLDPQELESAIDDGEDIIRKYNLEEINEEENDRQKYLRILDMYKRAGRIDRETLKPKLIKAAEQLGIKLQLNEQGEIEAQVVENYHKDLPNQRPLTPQEKELITKSTQKLGLQGKGYDWDQDTAVIYFFPTYDRQTKEYTGPEANYTLVVNRGTLHKVTLPQGARVSRVLGNMNYTDAYKSLQGVNEDLDVGHQDDEPSMLKKDIYDIAVYAAKLYKQLDKYDQMDGEVDFPHWWQGKVIKAREFISSAQHYLEAEEKQPIIDALALEGKEGASKEEEEKFHKKLDTLVHKTFGKRKEEMNEYNVNPEAEKYVKRFIAGVAKKYGYDEMDAVHLIYQVLANTGYLDMRLESINERVGALQDFINLVRDRAVDSEFSEQEEALEVIEALADHYGIKIQTGGFVGEGIHDRDVLSRPLSNPAVGGYKMPPKMAKDHNDDRSYSAITSKYRKQINDPSISDEELEHILGGSGNPRMGGTPNAIKRVIQDRNKKSKRKDVTEVKVGDTLTKDGKKGKVTKVSDTQATVDFGNGDVYGIAHSRIKGKEILKEEATCCGKCGRVHVKGNCKRPYLKGAKHCRNNK